MIVEYNRPDTLDQALELLQRTSPKTIPLGGGTYLTRHTENQVAVVDLQSLQLNSISYEQNKIAIGSMTRLQDIVMNTDLPEGLREAARRETNINIRRSATVGGVLVTSEGSSPLLGSFLALDARVIWDGEGKRKYLGEWLADDREKSPGKIILGVEFQIPEKTGYADICRSPEDKPQVFVATAAWGTGEIRVVIGGRGKSPILGSDGSKNMVTDVFNRYSYTAAMEREGYSSFEQKAVKTLIDRLVPQTGIFGGKGIL